MNLETKKLLQAGAFSGIIAGLFMAILLMIWSASVGLGFWAPAELIAGTVYGVDVILGGAKALITGLIMHVIVSAALGMFFVSIFRPDSRFARFQLTRSQVIVNGLVFGLVVWAAMTFAILPFLNPTLRERVALMPAIWFFAHAMYGIVLGALPETFDVLSVRDRRDVTVNVVEIKYRKAS